MMAFLDLGLTYSLPILNGLGLLPYVAMTVMTLSVRKSCGSLSQIDTTWAKAELLSQLPVIFVGYNLSF